MRFSAAASQDSCPLSVTSLLLSALCVTEYKNNNYNNDNNNKKQLAKFNPVLCNQQIQHK